MTAPSDSFDAVVRACMEALHRGAWTEALEGVEQATRLARSEADYTLVEMHRASIDILQGRPADLNLFRENVVRRHSARHVFIGAYYLVMAAVDRRDPSAAPRYLRALLDAADELGDPAALLRAREMAAAVESICGNHRAAVEHGRKALEILDQYEEYDAESMRIACTHNLAYNCLAANEIEEAIEHAAVALPLAEAFERQDFVRQCLVTASFAFLCGNRLQEAERLAERAAHETAGTHLERYAHYIRGEVARRLGDPLAAAEHFSRLEKFYPEIPSLTTLLLSMDITPYLVPE